MKDVKASVEELKEAGDILVNNIEKDNQVFFTYQGEGNGLMRTDLIDVEKVCYAKLTKADAMQKKLKKAVVKLDPNVNGGMPIVGQDYLLRITIYNYVASGDENTMIKHGVVHAFAGMTPTQFYEKLAESLTMNFSREIQPLLTFEPDGANGVIITEVEQPWVLGLRAQEPVNFSVHPTTVTWQGDDVIWAELNDKGIIELTYDAGVIENGKMIADLEYFCMGERADQYRMLGWPRIIPTKYMVDPTKKYDVLDIHYYYSGEGVFVQKSEKTMTFVAEEGGLEQLKTEIEGFGITIAD